MRVGLFGHYDKNYPRTTILSKGLKTNNIELLSLNESLESTFKVNFKNITNLSRANFNLIKQSKILSDCDFIINMYPGFRSIFLAKLLYNKPIIYDPFISLYNSWINDYHLFNPNSIPSYFLKTYERKTYEISDIILSDTDHHTSYYQKEFDIPKNKFHTIFVGADPQSFYPINRTNSRLWENNSEHQSKFIVSFIGNFIPLQGTEYIIEAAKILKSYTDIIFEIVGGRSGNNLYDKFANYKRDYHLNNVFLYGYQPFEKLIHFINRSDVQLGIFGETFKSKIVIPNKAFQAFACKKPLITAKSAGIKELCENNINVLLTEPKSGKDLAEKILLLYQDKNLGKRIAENGYQKFINTSTPFVLGKKLKNILVKYTK